MQGERFPVLLLPLLTRSTSPSGNPHSLCLAQGDGRAQSTPEPTSLPAGQEEGSSGRRDLGSSEKLILGVPGPRFYPRRNVQHLELCSLVNIPWDRLPPGPPRGWGAGLGAQRGMEEGGRE